MSILGIIGIIILALIILFILVIAFYYLQDARLNANEKKIKAAHIARLQETKAAKEKTE